MSIAAPPSWNLGSPASFVSGQFKGRTLRFQLEVAQEPAVGRKSGEKDRRPLANVPIARVKIEEVQADGSLKGVDESSVDFTSFHCMVGLTEPYDPSSSGSASISNAPVPPSAPYPDPNAAPFPTSSSSSSMDITIPSLPLLPPTSPPRSPLLYASSFSSNIATGSTVPQKRNHARIAGSSSKKKKSNPDKVVKNIFGTVLLNDLENRPGLWFVFQDIAVRNEGTYSLHFQVFDLESRTSEYPNRAPILAECYSTLLTIYAPRNHPGVPPSTKLAKHFVGQGYRLTLKKGPSSSSRSRSRHSPPIPTSTSAAGGSHQVHRSSRGSHHALSPPTSTGAAAAAASDWNQIPPSVHGSSSAAAPPGFASGDIEEDEDEDNGGADQDSDEIMYDPAVSASSSSAQVQQQPQQQQQRRPAGPSARQYPRSTERGGGDEEEEDADGDGAMMMVGQEPEVGGSRGGREVSGGLFSN